MRPIVFSVLGLALVAVVGAIVRPAWLLPVKSSSTPPAPAQTAVAAPAEDRLAAARWRSEGFIRDAVEAVGLPYPPKEIFLRAFKKEAELEVWAREDREAFRLVKVYAVLASSGEAGPKRREGDLQVPEGFYCIDRFNPLSRFHLSLRLNYPNDSDRVLSDHDQPGSDIFIHGSDVSIGCLPLGDQPIEELFVLATDVRDRGQDRIEIHLFPARMEGSEWERYADAMVAERPGLRDFWGQLQPVYEAFENSHQIPQVEVQADGRYILSGQ